MSWLAEPRLRLEVHCSLYPRSRYGQAIRDAHQDLSIPNSYQRYSILILNRRINVRLWASGVIDVYHASVTLWRASMRAQRCHTMWHHTWLLPVLKGISWWWLSNGEALYATAGPPYAPTVVERQCKNHTPGVTCCTYP